MTVDVKTATVTDAIGAMNIVDTTDAAKSLETKSEADDHTGNNEKK